MRQSLPPYDATTSFESGVNEDAASRAVDAADIAFAVPHDHEVADPGSRTGALAVGLDQHPSVEPWQIHVRIDRVVRRARDAAALHVEELDPILGPVLLYQRVDAIRVEVDVKLLEIVARVLHPVGAAPGAEVLQGGCQAV